jgi:D-serine deaminase-like pyridoxal phosphate-dependent protein
MTEMPFDLDTLETPAALVDLDRVEANLRRMAAYCREHGLDWRPHTKTHKTPELGRMQMEAGAVGLTVATLREGETMASVCDDILLAYPPLGPAKLERVVALAQRVRLGVALDSERALEGVARAGREAEADIGVLVEVDVGMHRVGVEDPGEAVRLARAAREMEGVLYRGILFYPGHIRGRVESQREEIALVSERLRDLLGTLEAADLAPSVVSGGSTPTVWRSHEFAGITEVRPGTNIFNDRTTAVVGACDWSECAYTVMATVVSTAVQGQAVVDAGSKALAREELRGEGDGYGALLDRPEVVVRAVSEEHGILDLSESSWRPEVGDRVRIIPNHVCVSVNLHEQLWTLRGARPAGVLEVAARGRTAAV